MSQHEKEILGNMGDFIDRRWTLTLIKKTQGNLALIMTRQTLEKKKKFFALSKDIGNKLIKPTGHRIKMKSMSYIFCTCSPVIRDDIK